MIDIFLMDFGGHDDNVRLLAARFPHLRVLRYHDSHLEMIRRAVKFAKTKTFWVISSCCDYSDFNFRWISKPWEKSQLHCWSSGDQKYGDTFYVNTESWNIQEPIEYLEWYHDVHYHPNGVKRLPFPIHSRIDDMFNSILKNQFSCIYEWFSINEINDLPDENPSLWKNRNLIALNDESSMILAPRDIKSLLKTQLYDYPYITKTSKVKNTVYDVVFISYDEIKAEDNWNDLLKVAPRAKRVNGVSGMVNALKQAAYISDTEYFYAVFGKTQINESFDFTICPDYLRHEANYIFHAYNPVIEYSYGHSGVILHNKRWLLGTNEFDIDVSMSFNTVVIPVESCVNKYYEDRFTSWRTAFREVYKLSVFLDRKYTIEMDYCRNKWMTNKSDLINADASLLGANLAFKMYKENIDIDINDWGQLHDLYKRENI